MEAKTLEEIREIRDVAKAAKAYAIAKKMGVEMKNEASEIEIRAIREMGKLIQEGQQRGEIATQERHPGSVPAGYTVPATLPEIGISRKESSTAKNLLNISDEVFEEKINEFKENSKPLTKTALLREVASENINTDVIIPAGKYRIVYADPPWKYSDVKAYRPEGAAENHYPVMSVEQICNMKMPDIEDNAVLFLWATSPLLEDCFKVIKAWGFQYKTSFVWDKVKHNMGHYNSVRHEFLLICTRGSCLPDNVKLFDSVQSIERTENHSEKPEEFRNIIDTLYPYGKRIELFARKEINGWECFGNQL
ncbi:MAG: MT-A70 family methyltransferase [Rikenellaceae bacterium]